MKSNIEEINNTLNEMIYHSDIYYIHSLKMDQLIYNYLNLSEDEALIESYDDRIEISFNTRKPDNEMVKKIYDLSEKMGTTINANLKYSRFQLDVKKKPVIN